MNVINLFDDIHSTKTIEESLKITDDKNLILIESLPWLLLRTSEGNLSRLLHNWSSKRFYKGKTHSDFLVHLESNVVMAVIPFDCVEENSLLKNLISISYITVRVKTLLKSETIEAKIEQRSRTNVETIKSVC
jgi:hypothetical protein